MVRRSWVPLVAAAALALGVAPASAKEHKPAAAKTQTHVQKQENAAKTSMEEGATYTVRKGDTLAEIAKRHHITVRALEEANHIKDAKRLRVGEKLTIPKAERKAKATIKKKGAEAEGQTGVSAPPPAKPSNESGAKK